MLPTTDAEENETESFSANVQEEIYHTPKEDMLLNTGYWNAKVGTKQKQMLLENVV